MYTVEQKQQIAELSSKGLSGRKIAQKMKLSKSGVNYELARQEVDGYSLYKQGNKQQSVSPQSTFKQSVKMLVIPDVQAKPGHDFKFLYKLGQYIAEKRPDTIVCLGDFADMPSLSSYDVGKKSFEGRRYKLDIAAARCAMENLLAPFQKLVQSKQYNPKMIMLYGNHENRICRAVNDDPKLDGVLSLDDLGYEAYGWTTVPFLDVHVEQGIAFSHYFTTGLAGRPASTASAQLNKKHMSCIAGHQQGLQIATAYRADGQPLTSIICGSFYEHDEDYMSAQGNKHWRGVLMLHEVSDGAFDLMPVSLNYLNKKYQ